MSQITIGANEIKIELQFQEFEKTILAAEKEKLNLKKEEEYNKSYNKIDVDNILNQEINYNIFKTLFKFNKLNQTKINPNLIV